MSGLEWGYPGLFLSAFLAATLLPAASELTLGGMALAGGYDPWALWLFATGGNVLGALLNWWLGLALMRHREARWFPFSGERIDKAQRFYLKWGVWSLLLAWAPVIGDPLTLVAGVFRVPWPWFVILVTLGKGARYGLILAALA